MWISCGGSGSSGNRSTITCLAGGGNNLPGTVKTLAAGTTGAVGGCSRITIVSGNGGQLGT